MHTAEKDATSDRRQALLALLGAESLDWGELYVEIEPVLVGAARDAARRAAETVGITDDDVVEAAMSKAGDWARAHSADLVGKRLSSSGLVDNPDARFAITDAARAGLKRTIAEAVESGASHGELAEAIAELYGFSELRAELIARTEINRAFMGGSLEAWRKSEVVIGKQWLMASTHDRDDECDDNAEAGVLKLHEEFPSGDQMPPAHPACKCSLLAVLKEQK